MTLIIGGQQLPVAQAGGDFLVLREPALLRSAAGELVISIDGHEDRWRVAIVESGEPTCGYAVRFARPHAETISPS